MTENTETRHESGETISSTMRGVLYRDERFLFGFVSGLAIAIMGAFLVLVGVAKDLKSSQNDLKPCTQHTEYNGGSADHMR